jgi:uncharacterized membrane protein
MKAHPIHLIVIHFPSALLVMDSVFAAISSYKQDETFAYAAYYCLIAGVVGGWAAIVSGMYDLFKYLLQPAHSGSRIGLIHAGMQTFMVLGFTIILSLEYNHQAYLYHPPSWIWLIKGLLMVSMAIGNYFGGELLLRYVSKEI